jgi:hypothetical protein
MLGFSFTLSHSISLMTGQTDISRFSKASVMFFRVAHVEKITKES